MFRSNANPQWWPMAVVGSIFLLGVQQDAGAKTIAFLSVAGEKRIAVLDVDTHTGTMNESSSMGTPGEPGALTTDSTKTFLFASMRSTGELTSFRIDPVDGQLTPISRIKAAADPAYVAVDPSNRFLLSAYYVAGKVSVHSISDNGTLAPSGEWYSTDTKAHGIAFSHDRRFVLVPHTGPNSIHLFTFDSTTGRLAKNPNQPILQLPDNSGPRHLALHPNMHVAFADNEQGGSVTMFALDPQLGTLQPKQTISTLPTGFDQANACARMELTATGRFLYVANRGHDSIAGFHIDSDSGELTSLGQFPTEKTPRSFSISPDDKLLIVAGQDSNRLASYQITADGSLRRLSTKDVGSRPWWITTVELP